MLQGIEFLHSQNVIHRDIKGKFRKLGNEYCVYFWIRKQLKVNIDHASSFIMAKQIAFSFFSFAALQNPQFSKQ